MPRTEENVLLEDDVLEVIAYLQDCFEKLDRGDEDMILGDPFYQRSGGKPPLSDEEIDRVVAAIDAEFTQELGSHPDYHRNRSGANASPAFDRLAPRARRAMVEGLDAILSRHRAMKSSGT